nr:TPA_inf: conotoxin precursor SF-mi2 [Conus judaeus]
MSTGGDAGPRRANGLPKHFVLRTCTGNCRLCGAICCCEPKVCRNNQCIDDK